MFSVFSREEPDNVRTSTPSLAGITLSQAIFYIISGVPLVILGVLFIGAGLEAVPIFTSGSQSWDQFFSYNQLFSYNRLLSYGWLLSGDLPLSWNLLFSGEMILGIMLIRIGAHNCWKAYPVLRQWITTDSSYLRLATAPVPLGETLRARLQVPISADEQPPSGFQVRVACTRSGDNGKEVVWEDSTTVTGQPGPGGTVVPLTFNLPTRVLPDEMRPTYQKFRELGGPNLMRLLNWMLEVTASFDDKPDYRASFDLPVSVPDDLDERADDASTASGLISSNESAEPESDTASPDASDGAYWSMKNDHEETDRAETDQSRSPSENESGADEKETFSEPVSAGIHMNGDPSAGLTFSFDHDRPSMRSRGYQLAGFGTITLFFGLGLFLFLGGMSALIGILLVLVGGVALHSSWKAFTHDTRLRVANGQIEVQKGAFFLDPTPMQISCDALADVKVRGGDYDVPADVKVWGGDDRYLVLKKQGTAGFIPVAPGLRNEDEAQWIADRIQEAARQQASAS